MFKNKYAQYLLYALGMFFLVVILSPVTFQGQDRALEQIETSAPPVATAPDVPEPELKNDAAMMLTDDLLPQNYVQEIERVNKELGITDRHWEGLAICPPPESVSTLENGIVLESRTALDFKAMVQAAAQDGIYFYAGSGLRDIYQQKSVIEEKLGRETIDEILVDNRPPGASQHCSGKAVDIISDQSNPNDPLSEQFASTDAYGWLLENAQKFNFNLVYEKGNDTGITFEPWHWFWREPTAGTYSTS